MAIVKCPNGHFFDNKKYAECPYCRTVQEERNRYEEQIRESVTIAMPKREQEESQTIGMYEPQPVPEDDQKTVSIFSHGSGRSFVTGWLVCTEGEEKGRDYRLYHGYNRIGRNYQMDVCIVDDPAISRENHASIIYDYKSNRFYLSPGKGTITTLNGETVLKAVELKRRDVICMGRSRFVFIPFCEEDQSWETENK